MASKLLLSSWMIKTITNSIYLSISTDNKENADSTIKSIFQLHHRQMFKLIMMMMVILASVRFGGFFSLPPTNISTFWPANAIIVALLLVTPYQRWGVYLICSLFTYIIAELWIDFTLELSLVYALSNCIGIGVAAYFIRKNQNHVSTLNLNISIFSFLFYTAFAATLAASISGMYTYLFINQEQLNILVFVRRWALADFTGYLLLVPLIYIVLMHSLQEIKTAVSSYWRDALPIFTILLFTCLLVSGIGLLSESFQAVYFYLPLPIILWATFKLGIFGAVFSMFIYALTVIIGALNKMGPFPQLPPEENIIALQIFIAINVFMILMVADLIKQRDQYHGLSFIDELTQIANYRHFDHFFYQLWQSAIREGYLITLISIDIDYFKNYNDCYGHSKGDECLRKISKAINQSVNRSTDLASRVGGEEFSCILSSTDAEQGLEVVKRIMSAINNLNIRHEASTVSDRVTVSIGISSVKPAYGSTYKALVDKADECLYEAKGKGRNTWVRG